MNISLDSSIFKDTNFLIWLEVNKERFSISISVVVYIETLLWYLFMGLSEKTFEEIIEKLEVDVVPVSEEIGRIVAITAKAYNKQLPFKHHARDYIIGITAITTQSEVFLTYNKKHYEWLNEKGISVMTPEEFLESVASE